MGVTSLMAEMSSPAACSDRIAASRPEPGPFTHTSTFFKPNEIASFAADSAEICAANGVLLREPLNPTFPALAQATVWPSMSVIVTIVLLNVDWTWAIPLIPTFRSRFFLGFGATAGAVAGASATRFSSRSGCRLRRRTLRRGRDPLHRARRLLGTLAGPRVGPRSLPSDRKILPMPEAPISADIHQALDVHCNLAAARSLDLELRLDHLTQAAGLLVREGLHARVGVDAGHRENLLRRRPSYPKDVRQRDFNALFVRQIDSGDTSQDAPPCLTLTLLVARVLANDAHHALAPDNLAVLANSRNGC